MLQNITNPDRSGSAQHIVLMFAGPEEMCHLAWVGGLGYEPVLLQILYALQIKVVNCRNDKPISNTGTTLKKKKNENPQAIQYNKSSRTWHLLHKIW